MVRGYGVQSKTVAFGVSRVGISILCEIEIADMQAFEETEEESENVKSSPSTQCLHSVQAPRLASNAFGGITRVLLGFY